MSLTEESETQIPQEVLFRDDRTTRKTYQTPSLVDWGSLVDLTQGSLPNEIEDPQFMGGSSGV